MHRIEFQKAYILHKRPYQETSLILELFTRDHGRFAVVAKGARRPKSKSKGALQPFTPLLISCVGRGEMLTLTGFEPQGLAHNLMGRRLVSGFYMNELLVRLLHRFDAHTDLFDVYPETLNHLAEAQNEQVPLRLFEKSLLKAIGYELPLSKEVETGMPVDPEKWYFFDPQKGPIELKNCHEKVSRESHYIQGKHPSQDFLFCGKSLLDIANDNLHDSSILSDAKRLMRRALACHLGDRPLESRRLL